MPRHPHSSATVQTMPGAVYSALAARLATYRGEVYPLHVGDTWLEPAEGCRMEDLRVADHPGMHRYAPPQGRQPLLRAIAQRVGERSGCPAEPESILVATGATGALGAVMGAILDPGDGVLILSPYWPLIAGIVQCFHGRAIEVPFIGPVDSAAGAVDAVEAAVDDRTVALYLSTPNNPTGRIIPATWLEALTAWARKRDLWIIADEVYEDYVYRGDHTYSRPMAPERTFSAHSFSKAYGMAGNRCGYVVGPPGVMPQLNKVSTHAFYSTPTASQLAAERALDGRGDAWVAQVREEYASVGRYAAERLGQTAPEGSTFLFVDVAERLGEGGLGGFLEDCADRGLFLAPGPSFGSYPTHVRICFTSAPPQVCRRGIDILAELLAR